MTKGPAAAAAAIGMTAVAIVGIAGPSRAATPTATTAPPPPRAGVYSGHTSQGLGFSVRVAHTRTLLASARFAFRVHCADHRTLWFTVSPIVARQPWHLNSAAGAGFTHAFHDTSGERYWISGRFTGSGMAKGTLSTSWRSPHNGICHSGSLQWYAGLAH
ncbi:MAG: hypothetical protein ACRDK8_10150 [Solirubrobacteraceae bacterium]